MKGKWIKRVTIDALWSGKHRVEWNLSEGVNVLSGVNGVGKSTIIRRLEDGLAGRTEAVHITYEPEGAQSVDYDVVRGYEPQAITRELLVRVAGVMDEMDAADRDRFLDTIDTLLAATGKTIVRNSAELRFNLEGDILTIEQLSNGERQMLFILLTILAQRREHCVLLMDEPEISLHIEWQQRLIALIRDINPNVQLILTTHSPAVIMDGWMDCVTDASDIIIN